jgi:hypothetical protein
VFGAGTLQATLAGALTFAGASVYVAQANKNTTMRAEVAAMHEQRQALPALRAENRQLAAVAAEVAALRHDDAEFQRLALRIAEVKKTRAESARLAQVSRRKQLEEWIREQDRLAQAEVDRMNREGNAMVGEFKRFSAQAKDSALPADARSRADAAAKAKYQELQAKQRQVQEYIAESRRKLSEPLAELRQLEASSGLGAPPGAFAARESAELAQRAAEIERRRATRTAPPSTAGERP